MKLILLFSSLAFALGENVTVDILSREFFDAVNAIEGPRRIAVTVPTNKFAREFTVATSELLVHLVLEYYRQARLSTEILRNDYKSSVSRLLSESNKAKYEADLEGLMMDVSRRLNEFLVVESPDPTRSTLKMDLTKIPLQSGSILTHLENYEPVELFNDLENLVDRDFESIYHLMEKMYSTGWQASRKMLGNLQQQFRNEFLHCTLLNGWIEDTRRIDEASETLRKHVRSETWREYEKLRERLNQVGKTVRHDREFCLSNV